METRNIRIVAVLIALAFVVVSCHSENSEEGITGRYLGSQRFGIGQVSSVFIIVLNQNGERVNGSVTPPFSTTPVPILNGEIKGNTVRFDRKEGNITFRYQATIQIGISMQPEQISGGFDPLGCISPSSGEPCLTDSDGTFTATKQ